jgi:hypothetical protein
MVYNNIVATVTLSVSQRNDQIFATIVISMWTMQKNKVYPFLFHVYYCLFLILVADLLSYLIRFYFINLRLKFIQVLDQRLLYFEGTNRFREILAL